MGNIKIISDFTDYYDKLSDESSNLIYKRKLSKCMQRGVALNFLSSKEIKTLEIKPVAQFNSWDDKLVVYKNPLLHHGKGKEIMDVSTAKIMYANCLASKYIEPDNLMSIKYLQVGKRRFRIAYKYEPLSLTEKTVLDIKESQPSYNMDIQCPIFSIDYISVNNVMVATDFNEVEELQLLNIKDTLSSEEVVEEIKQALLTYNKV